MPNCLWGLVIGFLLIPVMAFGQETTGNSDRTCMCECACKAPADERGEPRPIPFAEPIESVGRDDRQDPLFEVESIVYVVEWPRGSLRRGLSPRTRAEVFDRYVASNRRQHRGPAAWQ